MKSNPAFGHYLNRPGLKESYHLLVHSSFRRIRSAFPPLEIDTLIGSLQSKITPNGSVIMPAFSYCFKKQNGGDDIFDREQKPTKTGAVSEVFRTSAEVIRTSSPTYSFSLWGKITDEIDAGNSPESPLDDKNVLEWLSNRSAFPFRANSRCTKYPVVPNPSSILNHIYRKRGELPISARKT